MEGSPSWSRLKICLTAGIIETAAANTMSCVLPERRRAMWSGLLIVGTPKGKKIYGNMIIKIVNGHMFSVGTL